MKLFYSRLIGWDVGMYDEDTDTPASATNTSISEDLGQVQYVLSDKTGTLTQNVMSFRQCSINGQLFGAPISQPDTLLARAPLAFHCHLVLVHAWWRCLG